MSERPATIVTQTRVRVGEDERFAAWQERMSALVARAPGFVSQQVIPAEAPAQPDWVIIQRFETRADARGWLDSRERQRMLGEASDLLAGDDSISVLDESVQASEPATTAVIRTHVDPGSEDRFRAWHARVESEQATAPGYVGCALQEPIEGIQSDWVTILAFDSNEHLQQWLGSDRRARLMDEARSFMEDTKLRTVTSGFEGWFQFGGRAEAPAAPPWKFNYLILVGLYPIVMLEIIFLNPLLRWLPLALGNLIGNVLSVAILGWPVVALLSKVMSWWMSPPGPERARLDVKGALVMLAVLGVFIALFWVIDDNVTISPILNL